MGAPDGWWMELQEGLTQLGGRSEHELDEGKRSASEIPLSIYPELDSLPALSPRQEMEKKNEKKNKTIMFPFPFQKLSLSNKIYIFVFGKQVHLSASMCYSSRPLTFYTTLPG